MFRSQNYGLKAARALRVMVGVKQATIEQRERQEPSPVLYVKIFLLVSCLVALVGFLPSLCRRAFRESLSQLIELNVESVS